MRQVISQEDLMTTAQDGKPNNLAPDEKITPVAVYSLTGLAIGNLVTKEQIRVSTWLRTSVAPDYLFLQQARFLALAGTGVSQSQAFSELHIPTPQVIAFHMLPPEADPLDYDPNEPHRKMEPVSVLLGFFRFDASLRMSTYSVLRKFLEVTQETFIPAYDVEISNLAMPSLDVVRVSYALIRQDTALFATRS
jgi:hypothetical protein